MAQIIKILETTLTAGQTTLSITNAEIPYSIIAVNCDVYGVYPATMTISGNVLTLTYETQTTDLHLAISLIKNDLAVINNLTSDSDTDALSAAQGKALKALIDNIVVTGTLAGLDDVDLSSLTAGDILVYDGINEKWVNSSQPAIPSDISDMDDVDISSPINGQCLLYNNGDWINGTPSAPVIYSTTEQVIGTWLNNKPLYKKSFSLDTAVTLPYNAWTDSGVDIPDGICVDCECVLYQVDGNTVAVDANIGTDGSLYLLNVRNNPMDINTITVIYTKTTD